jgi:translation initiation factor 1
MSNKNKNKSGIVYSTNPNILQDNKISEALTMPPSEQDLKVWRDKKQRAGKTVTIIKGFIGQEADLEDLGKRLKARCGTGGTAKDGEIIIQGDFREKITIILIEWGYKAKSAGG